MHASKDDREVKAARAEYAVLPPHAGDDPDGVGLADEPQRPAKSLVGPAISNFAVQYNFQNIAIASSYTLGDAYHQAAWVSGATSAVAFAGAITGQLWMGRVGDVIGRTPALRLTLLLSAAGALLSAVLPWGPSNVVYALVLVCRFGMGVGVGGVYPLSATKTSEESTGATAAVRVAQIFFWQAPGQMAPYAVAMLLEATIGSNTHAQQQWSWRLLLGLGVVPSLLAYVYSEIGDGEVDRPRSAAGTELTQCQVLVNAWANPITRGHLIGCSASWFLYDVAYYGLALQIPDIIEDIYGDDLSLISDCKHGLILQSTGLPAVLLTIVALNYYNMRDIQSVTFLCMAVLAVVLAGMWTSLADPDEQQTAFFLICAALTFFTNAGVNITSFVLPSQLFEKHHRASLNGVSAASGKLGAVVGAYGLDLLDSHFGFSTVMTASAVTSLLGVIATRVFIPKEMPTFLPQGGVHRDDTAEPGRLESDGQLPPGVVLQQDTRSPLPERGPILQ